MVEIVERVSVNGEVLRFGTGVGEKMLLGVEWVNRSISKV